jgi:predicted RecA/RadA family phage recombinase
MSTPGTPANADPIALIVPTGGVVRGKTYVIGDNFAVATETKDAGTAFEAIIAGPVWAAKDPTASIEACAKIYLDEATGLITSDASKTSVGGFCLALASTADGSVSIMLGQPAAAGLTGATSDTNTALGASALDSVTDGTNDTAVGANALTAATSGGANTAVGANAAKLVSSGINNTAAGAYALQGATTGQYNTGVGYNVLGGADGDKNTAVGGSCGLEIVDGDGNAMLGFQGGKGLGDVSNTVAFGLGNGQGVSFSVNEGTDKLHIAVRYIDGSFKTADIDLA